MFQIKKLEKSGFGLHVSDAETFDKRAKIIGASPNYPAPLEECSMIGAGAFHFLFHCAAPPPEFLECDWYLLTVSHYELRSAIGRTFRDIQANTTYLVPDLAPECLSSCCTRFGGTAILYHRTTVHAFDPDKGAFRIDEAAKAALELLVQKQEKKKRSGKETDPACSSQPPAV